MPRASLPSSMKTFRSFELLVTSHTEDTIWDYFVNEMKQFDELVNKYRKTKSDFIDKQIEENPYINENFKTVVDKISQYDWIGDDSGTYINFTRKYTTMIRDFNLCLKELKWDDVEDKNLLIHDWIFTIESSFTLLRDNDEFNMINANNYRIAFEGWRKRNAKKLEEESNYVKHRFCEFRDNYPEQPIEGQHYYLLENGSRQYFNIDCSICVSKKDAYYRQLEYEKKQEKEQDELNEKYREEQRQKKGITKEPVYSNTVYECEDCAFKTAYKSSFNQHQESKEHQRLMKIKSWHCDVCNVQARSNVEWTYHLNTKKHKIAIGEVTPDPQEFHCEKCDYKTHLKGNWEKHLVSKKHKAYE
jgi:hypothetical protein